ncbi:MAG: Unknown protein [uncultured Sulfurovum sp.]|uniref:HTH cro/C1-type domain-containing protein n=1 Tax=uncultured Sulfurovum sp. TaxID=269237 RepID=A0A6S6TZF1_9BACT|nr:MAG: Unknown protein [uncultured Sulfurovum sp.]
MESDNTLHYLEERLQYVIKSLSLSTKDIARKLEISPALVSQIQNYSNGKLRKYHLYAICHAYNIPTEIFENDNIKTAEQIDKFLTQSKETEKIFENNKELLNKLVGTWYFYSYHSQKNDDIWQTETTIYTDGTVEDKHKNKGKIFIGKNQSLIIKETHNAKNLNTITFDNNRITYNAFPFSRISKVNALNNELLSFGFCSRVKLAYEEAKEVLGDYSTVQLKIDHNMLERIYNL